MITHVALPALAPKLSGFDIGAERNAAPDQEQ
jgi:hypothetical protein